MSEAPVAQPCAVTPMLRTVASTTTDVPSAAPLATAPTSNLPAVIAGGVPASGVPGSGGVPGLGPGDRVEQLHPPIDGTDVNQPLEDFQQKERHRQLQEIQNALHSGAVLGAGTTRTSQKTCNDLAKGIPGQRYRGGSYGQMTQPSGDGFEAHHMPSDAATSLPKYAGPAIQMETADHDLTASQSTSAGYQKFIDDQKDLVAKGDFFGAMQMDEADIHNKFGNKYNGAIAQAYAYARCLKAIGKIV